MVFSPAIVNLVQSLRQYLFVLLINVALRQLDSIIELVFRKAARKNLRIRQTQLDPGGGCLEGTVISINLKERQLDTAGTPIGDFVAVNEGGIGIPQGRDVSPLLPKSFGARADTLEIGGERRYARHQRRGGGDKPTKPALQNGRIRGRGSEP